MFPSLAAQETYVAEINFAARKQKNVFALKKVAENSFQHFQVVDFDGSLKLLYIG